MKIANVKVKKYNDGDNISILYNIMPDDSDVYVVEVGHIKTEPGRKQQYENNGWCIHYIIRGKATFNGKSVGVGDGYIMPPKSRDLYESDEKEPYEYVWIIIGGAKAKYFLRYCGFDFNEKLFKNKNAPICAEKIKEAVYRDYKERNLNLSLMGLLYELASFQRSPESEEIIHSLDAEWNVGSAYVKAAIDLIHMEYANDLTVAYVAGKIHISQNYLCRLFKRIVGCTPQAYIAQYRVEIAKRLLKETDWKIGSISESIGYMDSLYFSQIFKRYTDMTPTQYRKKAKEDM